MGRHWLFILFAFTGFSQLIQAPKAWANGITLELRSGYNVRTAPGMSSRVVGQVGDSRYRLTGKTRGVWHEVVGSSGRKYWVNRFAVRRVKSSPVRVAAVPPAPERKTEAVPLPVRKPVEAPQVAAKDPEIQPAYANPLATPQDSERDTEIQTQRRPLKPESFATDTDTCYFGGNETMKKNCESLLQMVKQGKLPKEATLYSLKTFKSTYGQYCDGNEFANKLKNDCSFFFTDLDSKYQGHAYRSPAYYIDLCAGDAKKSSVKSVVTSTYTNRGTGSPARSGSANYADRDGAKTTLAGVFRTGSLTGFQPYAKSRRKYASLVGYRPNDPHCQGTGNYRNNFLGKCGVLRLDLDRIGGSSSGSDKPMHTSGFRSSAGCPSLGKNSNQIMRHLASRGNSLYIAYTKQADQKKNFDAPAKLCRRPGNSSTLAFGNSDEGLQ